MVWSIDAPQGLESRKIRWDVLPYVNGVGLDLGAGVEKIFPHAISVDRYAEANIGADAQALPIFASHAFDFVFSSHLLEHMPDYRAALAEWWRLVKVGGHLILYLPHKDLYPNIGQVGANPDHKHDFLPLDILSVFDTLPGGWALIECQERNAGDEYSFLLILQKLSEAGSERAYQQFPKADRTAIVWRCGQYGDMLQTSSVLAGLKEQGYHVTLYSRLPGAEVIRSDPHIDRLILMPEFPDAWRPECWAYLQARCDRFVNLADAVEGTLLARPEGVEATWPMHARHAFMDRNYLEWQHRLAGVSHRPQVRFYATPEEQGAARAERLRFGPSVIVWSLAGTAVHKFWPFVGQVLQQLLATHLDVEIIIAGDATLLPLVNSLALSPRVHNRCGVWSIRECLAFLSEADLVIGPETSVLNAAAFLEIPKIIFLSHSSIENLTRDWKNTVSMRSRNTPCYPCHRVHNDWSTCVRATTPDGPINVAHCQYAIEPQEVLSHIHDCLERQRTRRRKEAACLVSVN